MRENLRNWKRRLEGGKQNMNKFKIRRFVFYIILAICLNVPIPEPYKSIEFHSIYIMPVLLTVFLVISGFLLICWKDRTSRDN